MRRVELRSQRSGGEYAAASTYECGTGSGAGALDIATGPASARTIGGKACFSTVANVGAGAEHVADDGVFGDLQPEGAQQ